MHFRVRGSNVQIVRSDPDPATGKAKSQPVGSANLKTAKISQRALAVLTPAEVTEVEAWLTRQREIEARRRELEFESLPAALSTLREWVLEAEPAKIDPLREEVMRGLAQLRGALSGRRRRRGSTEEAIAA